MPRAQFSIKTLLWLMALVGAFFLGVAGGNRRATIVIQGERELFRERMRRDRAELHAKEQQINELKEHVQALENPQP
ncbi:MAG TPA: hypothetical protein VHC22_17105 [Pirellulales bacterium]|nr:hypothetical protein [Pirellulales bacterium]